MNPPNEPEGLALDASTLQRQAIRGSLWTLTATAGSLPATFVSLVVAGRVLEPAGFGRYSLYAFYVPVALTILDLGLESSFAWSATSGRAGDGSLVARTLRATMTWNLLKVPAIAGGAFYLLRDDSGAAALLAFGLTAYLCTQGLSTAVTANRQYRTLSQASLLNALVGAAGSIVGAVVTRSPEWTIAGVWTGRVAVFFYLLWTTPAELRGPSLTPGPLRFDREEWLFGFSNYVSGLLSIWVFGRSELIFLNRSGNPRAQGQFAVVTTLAQRVTLLADALYGSLGIAMLAVRSAQRHLFVPAFGRAMRFSTLFAMTSAIALSSTTSIVAPWFFGRRYGNVVVPTVILLQLALLRTAVQPLFSWIFSERVKRALVLPGVGAAALDIGLCLWLVPRMPLTGALVANGISSVTFMLLSAGTAKLPAEALHQLISCSARFVCVSVLCAVAVVVPLPGGVLLHALLATLLTFALVAPVLRLLPPLLGADEIESVARAAPGPLRPAFVLVATAINGGRVVKRIREGNGS